MNNYIMLHKDILIKELGLPQNALYEEYKITGIYSANKIIFEYNDKFYQTRYLKTYQYHPWQFENMIKCDEVKRVEKLIEVWELVCD